MSKVQFWGSFLYVDVLFQDLTQLRDQERRQFGCCQRTTARKTPAISTWKCSCQKLAAHVQLLSTSSQPDFVQALGRRKTARIAGARFCTQSCSRVGQLLVNSLPTPHPMGSCRGLPCSSPLATPKCWERDKNHQRKNHINNICFSPP